MQDIDEEKVKWYLKQREKHRNIPKQIKISFNQFLKNIKAVKGNNTTNAGILFFGKNPLFKISNAQLRLSRIKGKEIYGPILDRKHFSLINHLP
ncbi:MAG: hypothetical protein KKD12_06505 [Proteobacteria bacterium]|nr:hypothetical protein [Pseudomonadota bacterium]